MLLSPRGSRSPAPKEARPFRNTLVNLTCFYPKMMLSPQRFHASCMALTHHGKITAAGFFVEECSHGGSRTLAKKIMVRFSDFMTVPPVYSVYSRFLHVNLDIGANSQLDLAGMKTIETSTATTATQITQTKLPQSLVFFYVVFCYSVCSFRQKPPYLVTTG